MAEAIRGVVPRVFSCYLPAGSDVRGILHADGSEALDKQIIRAEAAGIYHAGMILCNTIDEFERFLGEVEW
jgi:hypothetical protein